VNLPLSGAISKRTYNDPPSLGHKVCGWAALMRSPHLEHSRYAILAIRLIVATLQPLLAQTLWLQQRCSCYSGFGTQVGLTLYVPTFSYSLRSKPLLAQTLWLQQRCSCYSGFGTQVGLTLYVPTFSYSLRSKPLLAQTLWLQQRCSCYSGFGTQVGLTLYVPTFSYSLRSKPL
jgi:hypothetical protein